MDGDEQDFLSRIIVNKTASWVELLCVFSYFSNFLVSAAAPNMISVHLPCSRSSSGGNFAGKLPPLCSIANSVKPSAWTCITSC